METIDFSATLVRDTDGAQTNVRTEEGRDVIEYSILINATNHAFIYVKH